MGVVGGGCAPRFPGSRRSRCAAVSPRKVFLNTECRYNYRAQWATNVTQLRPTHIKISVRTTSPHSSMFPSPPPPSLRHLVVVVRIADDLVHIPCFLVFKGSVDVDSSCLVLVASDSSALANVPLAVIVYRPPPLTRGRVINKTKLSWVLA